MCLILFAWQAHPEYPLIVSANRDEFYQRPTSTAHWWEDHPEVLGGRDLEAGGTWMGVSRAGRWAMITNYRQFPIEKKYNTSRGKLVKDFLTGNESPGDYLKMLQDSGGDYAGYNLLFGTPDQLSYYSNRGAHETQVSPGVHGLSNHLLDTPWPKVELGKSSLETLMQQNQLEESAVFSMLNNQKLAPDADLPDTGIGLDWERVLSAMYIKSENYGTRASTLLLVRKDGQVEFAERSHIPQEENRFSFSI